MDGADHHIRGDDAHRSLHADNAAILDLQALDTRVLAYFYAQIAAASGQRRDELMRFTVTALGIEETDLIGIRRQVRPAAAHLVCVQDLVREAEAIIQGEQFLALRPRGFIEEVQAADVLEAIAEPFQFSGQLPVETQADLPRQNACLRPQQPGYDPAGAAAGTIANLPLLQ